MFFSSGFISLGKAGVFLKRCISSSFRSLMETRYLIRSVTDHSLVLIILKKKKTVNSILTDRDNTVVPIKDELKVHMFPNVEILQKLFYIALNKYI